jgi:glycosyltransferase involved in cell wall biosynthesis
MSALNFYAQISGYSGYAVHARYLLKALAPYMSVCLVPKFGLTDEILDPALETMLQRLLHIDLQGISVCLDGADEMYRFGGRTRLAYTVFESNQLSQPGLHQLSQLDGVIVPTLWAKQVLENQGLPKERLHIVPEGVDCQCFTPHGDVFEEITSMPGFRFLTVAKWETRKGLIELLRTWDDAFTAEDNVYLVAYLATRVHKIAHLHVLEEIDRLQLKNRDRLLVITQTFPNDTDMARLYRSCHAYVSAAKAEGWGLPLTEAMACGLPVIAPFYSGPTAFLRPEDSYCVDIDGLEDIYCPYFFPHAGTHGQWAKVNLHSLYQQMKHVAHHPEEAKERGYKASMRMNQDWTWDHAARSFADTINRFVVS